jgi:hypothetical protein
VSISLIQTFNTKGGGGVTCNKDIKAFTKYHSLFNRTRNNEQTLFLHITVRCLCPSNTRSIQCLSFAPTGAPWLLPQHTRSVFFQYAPSVAQRYRRCYVQHQDPYFFSTGTQKMSVPRKICQLLWKLCGEMEDHTLFLVLWTLCLCNKWGCNTLLDVTY